MNPWSKFKIVSQNCSSKYPLPKLDKSLRSTEQKGHQSSRWIYLQTESPPEPLVQIQNNFTESFLMMPSTQIAPNKGAAGALDKKCHLMTFPTDPLVQIQNNFTEFFLVITSTKIA